MRERRGSYSRFCCRLYPFICWIIIKEGPGNFSGGRSPHWVNHVNLCLSCIVCLLCFCFCICFILLLRGPVFLTVTQITRKKARKLSKKKAKLEKLQEIPERTSQKEGLQNLNLVRISKQRRLALHHDGAIWLLEVS
jgi:hypothetical protein